MSTQIKQVTRVDGIKISYPADNFLWMSTGRGSIREHTNLRMSLTQVDEGSTVVDVGAFIGEMATFWARRVKKVVAIEASAAMFSLLKKNLEDNNIANVEAIFAAAGSSCEERTFHFCEKSPLLSSMTEIPTASNGKAFEFQNETVPGVTIDSLKLSSVDYIKIDCEGAEMEVLEGARLTIANSHPTIQVEVIQDRAATFSKVVDFMKSMGYGYPVNNKNSRVSQDKSRKPDVFFLRKAIHDSCLKSVRSIGREQREE